MVYQGLPLAAVTVAGQPPQIIPSPLSGVVVAVNEALDADPAALLTDPAARLDRLHQPDAAGGGGRKTASSAA